MEEDIYDEKSRLLRSGSQRSDFDTRRLIKELDFSIVTFISGCGCWSFAFLWFHYGQISNILLATFLILFGLMVNVISLWNGILQYQNYLNQNLHQSSYYSFSQ